MSRKIIYYHGLKGANPFTRPVMNGMSSKPETIRFFSTGAGGLPAIPLQGRAVYCMAGSVHFDCRSKCFLIMVPHAPGSLNWPFGTEYKCICSIDDCWKGIP